jgi:hypothetical protein
MRHCRISDNRRGLIREQNVTDVTAAFDHVAGYCMLQ